MTMENTPVGKMRLAAFRKPWLGAFVLVSFVFACGMVVGGVVTSAFLWNRALGPAGRPGGMEIERLMGDMEYELLLSPEQVGALKRLFEGHRERIEAIRGEAEPKFEAEQAALGKAVEAVLTPEQAKRWRKRFDDMAAQFRRQRPAPADAPPPPPGDGRPPRPQEGPPSGRPAPSMNDQGPPPPPGDGVPERPRRGDDRRPSDRAAEPFAAPR